MAELAAIAAEARALESLDRVAKYKAQQAERERASRPQSATHAPAASTPAADRTLNEAAATASAPGTADGTLATNDDTSLLERDF
jgi:hypothetical protein